MKYLKYSENGATTDVTGENIKSSSTDARTIAEKLNIHVVTETATDLNNYKSHGIYYFETNVTPTNIPTGVNGWLIVLPVGNFVKQIWMRAGTYNTNQYMTYVREYSLNSNAWGDWKQVAFLNSNGAAVQTNSGGFIGYNGLCSNANNTYTQGQYHCTSSTTNLPAGASKYGILQVMVGDGGVQQNDSNAHSWCTQVYYDNNGRVWTRVRVKTSGSWSAWRGVANGSVDINNINLSALTWHTTGSGMYYSSDITPNPAFNRIDSVAITNWGNYPATLIIQPYINGNKVALMCSKNTFTSTAMISLRVTGSIA